LQGVRVLDMSRRYPGAFIAMYLGDFGADVIKVDRPGQKLIPAPYADDSERFAAHFPLDRNKRSVLIDYPGEEGRKVFYRLVETADVVIEGFRPGAVKRWQADYETLSKVNPRLIYCSLSGYGQDGPYKNRPGHDQNFISIGGLLSLIGPRDSTPCLPSNLLGDMAGGGLNGVIGVLLALFARQHTGKGQYIDLSYMDGAISLLSYEATRYFYTGQIPERGTVHTTGAVPNVQVYRCKDGKYFTVACFEPAFWENFCRLIGREDLIPYRLAPLGKSEKVIAEIQQVFLTRSRDEWETFFKDKEVCVSPVNNIAEMVEDPQVRHRQMVLEIDHPRLGKIKQLGIPVKLSDTRGEIKRLGVLPGTDTDDVLKGLGYSDQELQRLRKEKAVM